MRKIYFKLIVMLAVLLMSVSVVIMSSYAWLVLAGNPAATGIQVAIGGGNTILTAPNVRVETEDGSVYNYPGHFSDKLNFGMNPGYEYLRTLGNLTPVSTTNGVDWFLPEYYSGNDPEVQSGRIPSGMIKDVSQFQLDNELSYANLNPDDEEDREKIRQGSYVYLDFWVASPGGDYTVRVSTGEGTSDGGSFVVDLMEPQKTEDGFTLKESGSSAAAAVRIGFLANDLPLIDDTMVKYRESRYSDDRFTSLRGVYKEPETGNAYLEFDRFTIYEPNGDYHPDRKDLDGSYVITRPLGLSENGITEQDVSRNLTVQRKSTWAPAANQVGTAIEQQFQTALRSWDLEEMTPAKVLTKFYGNTLQGQFSPYVSKGNFLKRTSDLYTVSADGAATVTELSRIENAGATEDAYIIRLERNVPQRIRMFIWLEGQDADCGDSIDSARFAVNVELAGSDLE